MKKGKLSLLKIFRTKMMKNLPDKLFRIIIFLPAEYVLLVLGIMLVRFIPNFISKGSLFAVENELRFSNNITAAIVVFLLHILLYVILRFCVKLKKHYIDIFSLLAIASVILSPALFIRGSGPILQNFGFYIAIVILFSMIIFGVFSLTTALLDKRTLLLNAEKVFIAMVVGIVGGALVSWLLWIPVISNYSR